MRLVFLLIVLTLSSTSFAGTPSSIHLTKKSSKRISLAKQGLNESDATAVKKKPKKRRRKDGIGALITFGILFLIFGLAFMITAGILVLLSISGTAILILAFSLLIAATIFFIIAAVLKRKNQGTKE